MTETSKPHSAPSSGGAENGPELVERLRDIYQLLHRPLVDAAEREVVQRAIRDAIERLRRTKPAEEVVALRDAMAEIARIRLATDEGTLRKRADRMWSIAEDRRSFAAPKPVDNLRNAVIEECAKVADEWADRADRLLTGDGADTAHQASTAIASRIRALASPKQEG